jgi:hypothetical protein
MTVGKLDVEHGVADHLRDGPEHLPFAAAHDGKSALQHASVAEGAQKLRHRAQRTLPSLDLIAGGKSEAFAKFKKTLRSALLLLQNGLRPEQSADAIKPGPRRLKPAPCRAITEAGDPLQLIARTLQPCTHKAL